MNYRTNDQLVAFIAHRTIAFYSAQVKGIFDRRLKYQKQSIYRYTGEVPLLAKFSGAFFDQLLFLFKVNSDSTAGLIANRPKPTVTPLESKSIYWAPRKVLTK